MNLEIRRLSGEDLTAYAEDLGRVLVDAVASNAGISFLHPLPLKEAAAFFVAQVPEVAAGKKSLLAAFLDGRLVGAVTVAPAWQPNQPHRADLAKMMVLRDARQNGIGAALLAAAEATAREHYGRSLMTLDTSTGKAGERLYRRAGYEVAGTLPDYALTSFGELEATTFMYKRL